MLVRENVARWSVLLLLELLLELELLELLELELLLLLLELLLLELPLWVLWRWRLLRGISIWIRAISTAMRKRGCGGFHDRKTA